MSHWNLISDSSPNFQKLENDPTPFKTPKWTPPPSFTLLTHFSLSFDSSQQLRRRPASHRRPFSFSLLFSWLVLSSSIFCIFHLKLESKSLYCYRNLSLLFSCALQCILIILYRRKQNGVGAHFSTSLSLSEHTFHQWRICEDFLILAFKHQGLHILRFFIKKKVRQCCVVGWNLVKFDHLCLICIDMLASGNVLMLNLYALLNTNW